ncbi:MAG TPA: hypothetical protein VHC97_02620 [Thermoanaerobaculia bacterium]|jgi:hypothetical protein|nr:hypothetical protein [Thermoanaerobaculia bacterium]
MAGISFAKTVSDCELMKDALEPHLTEMPHLAEEHGELAAFLAEVKSLNARQKDLTGELRQITRRRKEAELRGQDLRSRVAALIRGKLGFKNETLLKFGIPPRRKTRRKTAEEPTVKPAPAEPVTPAAA